MDTNLAPRKIIHGLWPRFHFIGPWFNAYTHVETVNSSTVQFEGKRVNCKDLAILPVEKTSPLIDKKENAVLMQTELRS